MKRRSHVSEAGRIRLEKVRLENGLTLLLKEDRRAPIFSMHVTVRAGVIYEGEWLGTGISHFLEHVIDDGTLKRSREEIDDLVEQLGNVSNAYTARDHTRYFVTAPRAHADVAFDLFADFVQRPTLPQEDMDVQRGVILNEFNSVDDSPDDRLARMFYETVYRVHPFRVPIEGYRRRFEKLTRDDLVAYHERLYAPENIVVSVVGDLDIERVQRRLNDLWGKMPQGGWLLPSVPVEPRQVSPRECLREGPVELGYGLLGFRTFAVPHADAAPLFVLSAILGGGESSRFYRILKNERRVVHSVTSWTEFPNAADGLLGVSFSCDETRIRDARMAILAVIEQVRDKGVSSEELATAKAIAEAESLFAAQTVEDEAATFGFQELLFGDAEYHHRFLQQIRDVESRDVQRVGQAWLKEESQTFVALHPKRERPSNGRALRPATSSAPFPISRSVLPNGLRLIVQENHAQPTVYVGVFFNGGVYHETVKTNGVSHLTAELALRGTETRTSPEIAPSVESRGGLLDAVSGNHSFGFSLNVLTRDLPRSMDILADVIRHPSFDADEFEALRRDALAVVRSQKEDAYDIAYRSLLDAFYAHHPYRFVPEGTAESLRSLTVEDCRKFHGRMVLPNRGVVGVVGDVRVNEVEKRIASLFGDWEPQPAAVTRTWKPRRTRETRIHQARDMAQAILCLGYPGLPFTHPDSDAMLMLQATLAGLNYPGGRLYKLLRQRQLVYEVSAEHQVGMDEGMLHVFAATTHDQVNEVLSVIDATIEDLKTTPISEEEYRRVQQMCLADFFIHLQTNEERAYRMGLDELYGLGYDYMHRFEEHLRSVTPAEIRRVANVYLQRRERVVSIVSKPQRGAKTRA